MSEYMGNLVKAVSETVWGVPMLILLSGCGMFFSIRLGFFQITKIPLWIKETFGTLLKHKKTANGKISPYRAVSAALASSIGTGNIVGVATAIASGGPGAVFWMWISAFFGMATKYAEILLAVRFRIEKNGETYGGPMYYIEKGLGKNYRWLAVIFSISGVFACLGMGGMSQANSISSVIAPTGILSEKSVGVILGVIALIALNGGISRVSSVAGILVPVMAGMYLLGGAAIFFIYPGKALDALRKVFVCALSPSAVYGASSGIMVKRALRFGVARGVFSNEAGLGSSPMIHASSDAGAPAKQGFWGVFEVFADTILVCSVTAVIVISADVGADGGNGTAMVSLAFGRLLGDFGYLFVNAAICLFAFSTILGWSYYGERCVSYLTKEKKSAKNIFRAVFSAAVVFGSCVDAESVWALGDIFNGIMMIPNLIALFLLSETVIKESRGELRKQSSLKKSV